MSVSLTRPPLVRSRRWRGVDVVLAVLLAAIVVRTVWPGAWRVPSVQAWTLVFGAVCVQASPYVVLGVVLSAVVAYLPTRWLQAVTSRRTMVAVPVAALLGAFLPGCECGSVPLATSMLRRGVPVGPAVSLMLSAPATNPVVLAATAAAFPGRPGVVAARFCASLAVAVVTGWVMGRRRGDAQPVVCGHEHAASGSPVARAAAHDLAQSLGMLTVGAASAATVGVLVPPTLLGGLAGTAAGGVLALALLAVVLAVCSEADAFIASSLTQFSVTAQLVFMVVGPAVDLKLLAMQAAAFGGRFTVRLATTAFAAALGAAAVAAVVFT